MGEPSDLAPTTRAILHLPLIEYIWCVIIHVCWDPGLTAGPHFGQIILMAPLAGSEIRGLRKVKKEERRGRESLG